MAKQTLEQWHEEDAKRVEEMGAKAHDLGIVVDTLKEDEAPPPLEDDGSLTQEEED